MNFLRLSPALVVSTFLVAFAPAITLHAQPVVSTLPASNLHANDATLNGSVNPKGLATTAWFAWGASALYGATTAPTSLGNGNAAVALNAFLNAQTAGVLYHYRTVATNSAGHAYGVDRTFEELQLTPTGGSPFTNECHTPFVDPGVSGPLLAVAAGYEYSLALRSDGTVAAWGDNTFGEANVPAGLSSVVAIAAGEYHGLALQSNGTVVAWGKNAQGQAAVPPGLTNAIAISGGFEDSLAVKSDGTLVAWGSNNFGELNIPPGLSNLVTVAAGWEHCVVLKSDGTLLAWGNNANNQTNIPAGLTNVVAIAAGDYHSLALKSDGTVVAWGANDYGQTNVPSGLSGVVAIAAGFEHSLAVKNDGTVVRWGINNSGQLTPPPGLNNAIAMATGDNHALALLSNGGVAAWGDNSFGETNLPPNAANFTTNFSVTGSANANAPGSYNLTYIATNVFGGSNTVTRTVVVADTTPPVITILGANPLTNLVNTPYVDPGATALDACAGPVAVTTNSNVNVSVVGTYTVTYTATDGSGNSATNTRTVVITATEAPVITGFSVPRRGQFELSFAGNTNATYSVLASTNVTLPVTNWTVLGSATLANGQFQFLDTHATNLPLRFYRLSTP